MCDHVFFFLQISAFALQECTNSHAANIARYFNISSEYLSIQGKRNGKSQPDNHADNFHLYPTSPEEFGVLAIRLSQEQELRASFVAKREEMQV